MKNTNKSNSHNYNFKLQLSVMSLFFKNSLNIWLFNIGIYLDFDACFFGIYNVNHTRLNRISQQKVKLSFSPSYPINGNFGYVI